MHLRWMCSACALHVLCITNPVLEEQVPETHLVVCVGLGVYGSVYGSMFDSCRGPLADQDDASPSHRSLQFFACLGFRA